MLKLFLVLLFIDSSPILAWQENVRIYQQCSSCHVSPSGGGVLTEYGKGLSTQFATFDKESFGPSNYSAFKTPKNLLLGGNVRNLYIKQEIGDFERERIFLMQADMELAIMFKNITVVGTAGVYNVDYEKDFENEIEYRRYYAKYQFNENMIFRVGQFFTNFGLMLDDHTETIRTAPGYGQNTESKNYELGYYSELFNLVGTLEQNKDGSFGDALDLRIFPWKMVLGASIKEEFNAFYVATPITKRAYLMAEYLTDDIYYLKTGFELYRGIVPYVKYTNDSRETYSIGSQLHFMPHLEFLLESSHSKGYADFTASSNYYF